MTYEIRPNSGNLFTNTAKKKPEHPDMTGKINIEGKLYYISGWSKTTRDKEKYISLAVKPIERE